MLPIIQHGIDTFSTYPKWTHLTPLKTPRQYLFFTSNESDKIDKPAPRRCGYFLTIFIATVYLLTTRLFFYNLTAILNKSQKIPCFLIEVDTCYPKLRP